MAFINFGNILNSLQSGARAGAALSSAVTISTGPINMSSHIIGDVAAAQRSSVTIQGYTSIFLWGSHLWANQTNKVGA